MRLRLSSPSPFCFGLLLTLLAAGAFAGEPAPAATKAPAKKESSWIFDLLPRPFSRNPRLDFTVITEFSDEGKKRPAATSKSPVYYALHSAGHVAKGDSVKLKPMAQEQVEKALRPALARAGFLPADDTHPPGLLVVYYWGIHSVIDPNTAEAAPEAVRRNVYDRAALVGGQKFAHDLKEATERTLNAYDSSAPTLGHSIEEDGGPDLGAAAGLAVLNGQMNPLKLFMQNTRNDFLVRQATDDCYYVVASAFDYQSIATPKKQLLWRTHMTAGANGGSETETLPVMIRAAAEYFGREMPEAAILSRRTLQDGSVEVGAPEVVPAPDEKKK